MCIRDRGLSGADNGISGEDNGHYGYKKNIPHDGQGKDGPFNGLVDHMGHKNSQKAPGNGRAQADIAVEIEFLIAVIPVTDLKELLHGPASDIFQDSRSDNAGNPGEEQAVLERLRHHQHLSLIHIYPNKNQGTLDLLANKEVDMIPAWACLLYTSGKDVILLERNGTKEKTVSLYIKFNKLDGCFVIVISFHEQKYPLTYYFR